MLGLEGGGMLPAERNIKIPLAMLRKFHARSRRSYLSLQTLEESAHGSRETGQDVEAIFFSG
jgi:hypothetical protein